MNKEYNKLFGIIKTTFLKRRFDHNREKNPKFGMFP